MKINLVLLARPKLYRPVAFQNYKAYLPLENKEFNLQICIQ